MTTLAPNSFVSFLIQEDGHVIVNTYGALASVTITPIGGNPVVTVLGPLPMQKVFGPYGKDTNIRISNSTAILNYEYNEGTPPKLTAQQIAEVQALLLWGGKSQAGRTGIVTVNNGQVVARSLVPGPGIEILYPLGIGGDPTIYATPGRVLLGSLLGANLAVTTDQAIVIREWPQYIVTDIILTNASADPVAASGGVYSTTGKAGRVLAANQSLAALDDDSVALPLTMGVLRRLTGPAVYLSLTVANGVACTADVYVFGYWLMG